ncbi:MAG TPA: integrase core domain-containing protein [Bacteroidia bacterium]|nr:integrase core domain-containing protein [Bacteroidia bacterium]
MELGTKHRYTWPYRPQTNGKVERFWRILEDNLLRDTFFDSLTELKDELIQYLYYYNHGRPRQGINNLKPIDKINPLPN